MFRLHVFMGEETAEMLSYGGFRFGLLSDCIDSGSYFIFHCKCENNLRNSHKALFLLTFFAGGIGASFQCQLIHQDHICTDDSDKVIENNEN